MNEPDIAEYLGHHAPELDAGEVAEWMAAHPKPDEEPGSHLDWAVRVLRQLGETQLQERLDVDRVADEIRRRDA
ncbi:MAG: hypothetical protein JOZ07_04685 [Solirubrobacterales bacterium]|nr:hypothetical protein [Solirubrobacterales bacterium]